MRRILSLFFLVLLGTAARGEPLDLRRAERLAIERNLDLRAQQDFTRAADAFVRGRYGIYNPRLEADLATGVTRDRVNLFFLPENADLDLNEVKYRRWDFSLIQRLPTGADIALDVNNRREDVLPSPQIDPAYISNWRLSLIQPLLRNFGREVTEQEILFAINDRQQEVENLRERAFFLVRDVRNAYFDVLRYRDNVLYRETSVELARQVLRENRARVDAGVLPPVENLEAEVGVHLRERELLDARRAYHDALDRLTLLLNASEQVEVSEEALLVSPLQVDEEAGFLSALESRPDVRRRLREIERLELTQRIARNRTLPEVNLGANYGHSGLERSYGEDLEQLGSNDFRSWEVGLTFSYPLGNTEARNELYRARHLLQGNRNLLGQLKEEIQKEIRAAVRDLDVNLKKIEVTDLATRLSAERLQTLIKRKEVGLATTRDVLEGEEDLAQARTDHIAALADYNAAVTEYLRATGFLLEREGIRLAGETDLHGTSPLMRMD